MERGRGKKKEEKKKERRKIDRRRRGEDSKEDLYVTKDAWSPMRCPSTVRAGSLAPYPWIYCSLEYYSYLPRVSTTEFHAGLSIDFSIT